MRFGVRALRRVRLNTRTIHESNQVFVHLHFEIIRLFIHFFTPGSGSQAKAELLCVSRAYWRFTSSFRAGPEPQSASILRLRVCLTASVVSTSRTISASPAGNANFNLC